MKNKILYITVSILSTLALTSCKNDLDVLAPGEESVSVYGVLNPNLDTQNIRINKVYLTDGDAITAGQDVNQINYGPGELEVSLERYLDGVQMNVNSLTGIISPTSTPTDKRIALIETVVSTASGSFNQNQRIWQTSQKLFVTTPTPTAAKQNKTEYKLTIKILSSGKEITAQTIVVDSVKSYPGMPFIFVPTTYPVHCGAGTSGYVAPTIPGTGTQQSAYVNYNILTQSKKILFKSVPNAKLYKVIMRFHYIDSLMDGSGNRNYVDYNFNSLNSNTLVGNEELAVSFEVKDLYTLLASEIPKKTTGTIRHRTAHYIEYIIYACSENMNTFLKVNQPSTTIAQDKPNYTNINGGVGIFASVSKTALGKELWSDFIDELSNNPTTSSLLFVKRYKFICP